MSETEYRIIEAQPEIRARGDKEVLEGRFPYGVMSKDLGGFNEVVMPGAFSKHLSTNPQVPARWEHGKLGSGIPLGSTHGGSLRIFDEPAELRYEVDKPPHTEGREVFESIRRGDVPGTSFGMNVINDKFRRGPDGGHIREIHEAQLTDVSPTTRPAYPKTNVKIALRSLETTDPQEFARLVSEEERRAMEQERSIKPGHFVRFMHADGPRSAHIKVGKVVETRSDGRLSMPMGGMYCEGTRDNPAHMVAEYRDDDGDGVHEPSGHLHLVNERDMEKMDDAETITDEQALTLMELLEQHEQQELQGRQDKLRLLSLGPTVDEGASMDGAPSYE